MSFAEIELARIDKIVGDFCNSRIPAEVRHQLRLEYTIKGHDVEIFEVRPLWNIPGEELQTPIAKIKYVRTAEEWRLYWMRSDLRWHSYTPYSSSRSLEKMVRVIDEDELCCFFG